MSFRSDRSSVNQKPNPIARIYWLTKKWTLSIRQCIGLVHISSVPPASLFSMSKWRWQRTVKNAWFRRQSVSTLSVSHGARRPDERDGYRDDAMQQECLQSKKRIKHQQTGLWCCRLQDEKNLDRKQKKRIQKAQVDWKRSWKSRRSPSDAWRKVRLLLRSWAWLSRRWQRDAVGWHLARWKDCCNDNPSSS